MSNDPVEVPTHLSKEEREIWHTLSEDARRAIYRLGVLPSEYARELRSEQRHDEATAKR